jgi:hypothetical protein
MSDKSAAEEIEWAIRRVAACSYVPMIVAYPLFPDSVAGDASSSVGWGVCVGPFIAFGRWTDATIAAFNSVKSVLIEELNNSTGEMVKLSISPAELFVSNLPGVATGVPRSEG